MLLELIGLTGVLMVILGLACSHGIRLRSIEVDTKQILALGTFILAAIVLLKLYAFS